MSLRYNSSEANPKENTVYDNLSMPVDLRKIEVYGSHTKHVEADQAVMQFTISGQHVDPKTVMAWIAKKAEAVEEALGTWKLAKVKTSRAKLTKKTRKVKEKTAAFQEYFATSIHFWVSTPEVEKIMEMQMKLVELGVTEICPTVFTNNSLKRHYSEVRRKAMKAARDKAELYCKEAGVRVGPPITIRDVNTDFNEGRKVSHDGNSCSTGRGAGDGDASTSGPELIAVSGTLQVVFEILVGAYMT